jgi:hypothetical protein
LDKIRAAGGGVGARTERDARARLEGIGYEIFDLAPQSFKDAYWTLRDAVMPLETVLICRLESFPWEIMTPHRNGERAEPLGVAHAIARWSSDLRAPAQTRFDFHNGYVIAPSYRPRLASAIEADYLVNNLGGERITPATNASVEHALAERAAPLLHISGHLTTDEIGTVLLLDNDEPLSMRRWRVDPGVRDTFRTARPFVFVNACRSGRGADLARSNLPVDLVQLGARGIIALSWEVPDEAASRFAIEFYERARRFPDVPCAEILRQIRREAFQDRGDFASSAAYAYFGSPFSTADVGTE